jgi:hypothetical protein
MMPSLLIWRTVFGQRVRFMSKLLRPHPFALKSKFSLKLSDISVVRDILYVFLEVLPCFHMTVLSSSWVSYFSKSLFSPRIYTGYPGLVGWAWTTTWRVESQKLYMTLSSLKGYLVVFMLKQDNIFSLDPLSSHLWFEFGLSTNQSQPQGLSLWCFIEYTFTSFGLTNTFALFLQHMSPSSWST